MICETPEGYRVRLWEPGKPPMEWGGYPTWQVAFAVEQRLHEQLRQERERPQRPRANVPAPTLWDALDGAANTGIRDLADNGRVGNPRANQGTLAGEA